jgi:hypothetical protein
MKRPVTITVCGLKRPTPKRLLGAIGEMAKAAARYEDQVAALFRLPKARPIRTRIKEDR